VKKIAIIILLTFSSSLLTLCAAQSGIINTIAGNGIGIDSGDGGLAIRAALDWPSSVAIDKSGNIYIAEENGNRIRKINVSGVISTIAGNGTTGSSGDGGPATAAELNFPTGVCTDSQGNVYIADNLNQVIRKVNIRTGIIKRIAGQIGWPGIGGDSGFAIDAYLNYPNGIAVDKIGNIYIADEVNNKIRKIDTLGIITTIAGCGGQGLSGDGGPAINADLYFPTSVCTDTLGNIFFADRYNQRIRKVNIATGIISSVAGSGDGYSGAGYSGDGGPATSAELYDPDGIAIDKKGNLYIADQLNKRIREVDAFGNIHTIAGDGIGGFSGDGGPGIDAKLNLPGGIAVDSLNNIYIADVQNMRIRKVNAITTGIADIKNTVNISIFPNPNNGTFTIAFPSINGKYNVEVYNILGENVFTEASPNQTQPNGIVNISNQPNGIYLYRILNEDGSLAGEGKVIIVH